MAATTAAIIGIAASATGTYMSFKQMGTQAKNAAAARKAADEAIIEAKRRAEQNAYKALSVTKEPYERAREAAIVSGAQAIEAGRESERGGVATAGRVQMAQNELQMDIANKQAQEIQDLNKVIATEDARLKDYAANIALKEVEGAQEAAANAEKLRAQAGAQAVQGLAGVAKGVDKLMPLYQQSQGAKQYQDFIDQATASGLNQEQIQNKLVELSRTNPEFAALSGVGYTANSVDAQGNPVANMMTPLQFQDYMSQRPDFVKDLINRDIFATPAQVPTYIETPSSTESVLFNQPSSPSMTPGVYKPSDLKMLPPDLLRAYGIDPFSIQ